MSKIFKSTKDLSKIILQISALSVLISLSLEINLTNCESSGSYLTLGDAFLSQTSNDNLQKKYDSTHFFSIGFITEGICESTPKLLLTSSNTQIKPIELMPYLQDIYSHSWLNEIKLPLDTTIDQSYQRTSHHFKISLDLLEKYTNWQIIINGQTQG